MAVDLAEQIAYYRARASEYDEWWERRGRFDRGPAENARWFTERAEVDAAFAGVDLGEEVLELAPGTGYWTAALTARGTSVTAIDASPEMVEINRARLGLDADRVEYRIEDLFAWQPDREWDACVFCFFISHVPDDRLDGFLATVRSSLRPGGSLFFLDGRKAPTGTAADQTLPDGGQTMVRRLNDGREFTIVKNFWSATRLAERCAAAGLAVEVSETATFFQYAIGTATF